MNGMVEIEESMDAAAASPPRGDMCSQNRDPAEILEQIGINIKECIHVGPPSSAPGEISVVPRKQKREFMKNRGSGTISFSASLPSDVYGVVADSIAVVKHSWDPYSDFRSSIVEMITELQICDWLDLEELLYCYLSLNSSDFHYFIEDAFKSVVTGSNLIVSAHKTDL